MYLLPFLVVKMLWVWSANKLLFYKKGSISGFYMYVEIVLCIAFYVFGRFWNPYLFLRSAKHLKTTSLSAFCTIWVKTSTNDYDVTRILLQTIALHAANKQDDLVIPRVAKCCDSWRIAPKQQQPPFLKDIWQVWKPFFASLTDAASFSVEELRAQRSSRGWGPP